MTDDLFRTFLVYAACSGRPLHELIDPNLLAIDRAFAQEFDGMTIAHVPLEARERPIEEVRVRITGAAAEFLLSAHDADPNFNLIALPAVADLPAIRWKLLNLRKLIDRNPEKHADQRARLDAAIRR